MDRNPRWLALVAIAALVGPTALVAAEAGAQDNDDYTQDFRFEDCRWSSVGRNPFFPLKPGFHSRLEGEDEGEEIALEITVLDETQWIRFFLDGQRRWVKTRVVEEREWIDGELFEVSRNFVAMCRPRNDAVYFGEDVDFYEDGEIVGHGGSWRAGENGALPGILMPGTFLLGSRYFQEVAPGVALDRGEHIGINVEVETEAGEFEGCVEILDTDGLEPDAEGDVKTYCPGLGLTIDEELELVHAGTD